MDMVKSNFQQKLFVAHYTNSTYILLYYISLNNKLFYNIRYKQAHSSKWFIVFDKDVAPSHRDIIQNKVYKSPMGHTVKVGNSVCRVAPLYNTTLIPFHGVIFIQFLCYPDRCIWVDENL